jgi:CubicO group peptidase (beta-lactamase class C family)
MKIDIRGAGLDDARLARIGDHLDRHYLEPGKLPGYDIAVMRRGRLAWRRTAGFASVEQGRPLAEDAIYRIYSMTKPVTSVALMQLYEQARFQLDEPVARFLPEWSDGHRVWTGEGDAASTQAAHRPISFRDLLSHTSGLTYGPALRVLGVPPESPVEEAYVAAGVSMERDASLDAFVAALAKVPLRYQPGERWMYSVATDVCGALVERISGKTLDRYFEDEIFGPLGMSDTGFHVPADKAARLPGAYMKTVEDPRLLVEPAEGSPYLTPPSFRSGGGGLVSTMADYLRFSEMLRNGGALDGVRVIGRRTVELMGANHLKDGRTLNEMAIGLFSETTTLGAGFGLGLASTIDPVAAGSLAANDRYWGGAASTYFWFDPEEELSVVFMTQLFPSTAYDLRRQLKQLVYAAIED